jgi:YD repeat-containing protein
VATFQLYDGHGRIRQAQEPGPGGRLVSDTFYTATGQVAKVNDEYLVSGAPGDRIIEVNDGSVAGQVRTEYDGVDRPTVEIQAVAGEEKWRTVTRYGGDRVHVDPPDGGTPTTTIMTARNTVDQLWQYKGPAPTGEHETLKYTHTPGGQLATYTDAAQNVWRNVYDQRGRLTATTSPDAGTVSSTYDDPDQALTQTAADRTTVLSHDWDELGRTTATYRGDGPNHTKITEWVFDRTLKGQLDFSPPVRRRRRIRHRLLRTRRVLPARENPLHRPQRPEHRTERHLRVRHHVQPGRHRARHRLPAGRRTPG